MAQRKRNIEFANPDEPAFLKKMKAKIGFQGIEKETVETKVMIFFSEKNPIV